MRSVCLVDIHCTLVFVFVVFVLLNFLSVCFRGQPGRVLRGHGCGCVRLLIGFGLVAVFVAVLVRFLLTLLDDCTHAAAVLLIVLAVHDSRRVVGGRIDVGVSKQRLNGRQNAADVVDGGPRVLEDVQADAAVCVNVRMKHFG